MAIEIIVEKQFKDLGESELWKVLKEKVSDEGLPVEFLIGVGEICKVGIEKSKDIIRFFPNFTLHDITHIKNVCSWMYILLGERAKELTAAEAALLVMAACCHDIGMSVSKAQEQSLKSSPNKKEWKEHFKKNPGDEDDFVANEEITPKVFRNYIRQNHHKRICEFIKATMWPLILTQYNITRQVFINLCSSHGEELSTVNQPEGVNFDLRLCAILLRLADILDFDSSRAPQNLYEHLGLNEPKDDEQSISQIEWLKNQAGGFRKVDDDTIKLWGRFTSLQLEKQVRWYVEWVEEELLKSMNYLSIYKGRWSDFNLPKRIITEGVERVGYKFGDFHLTMDQDQVLNLLIGQDLYQDPGVFVRELIQNSIDAILHRRKVDPSFGDNSGKITIRTWKDDEGYNWFQIEDDGTGMDENIIMKYFLKIGRSYYTSKDYIIERRKNRKKNQEDDDGFMPTSRFGIGILSCFMGDPKNNRLEMSTKRYSEKDGESKGAIRLNIDGLYGYYYYAEENEQNEQDDGFIPMQSPKKCMNTGYRSEVGTTINVRTNRYQLKNTQSFMEIVDRYVMFPDVCIEYIGEEDHKFYPTRTDMIEAFSNLSEVKPEKDGIISAKYELPFDIIAEINRDFPGIKWITKPAIILKYCSLNKLSVDKDLFGLIAYIDYEGIAEMGDVIQYNGKQYKQKAYFITDSFRHFHSSIYDVPLEVHSIYPDELKKSIKKLHKAKDDITDPVMLDVGRLYESLIDNMDLKDQLCRQYGITMDILHSYLGEYEYRKIDKQIRQREKSRQYMTNINKLIDSIQEKKIIELLLSQPEERTALLSRSIIAYNGVMVQDNFETFGFNNRIVLGDIVLLNGEKFNPSIRIAREGIKNLPFIGTLNLSMICHKLSSYLDNSRIVDIDRLVGSYMTKSERDYLNFLNDNPRWEKAILINNKHVYDLKPGDVVSLTQYHNDLICHLALAILKKYYNVYICSEDAVIIQQKIGESQTMDFPVQLFYHYEGSKRLLAMGNKYNIDHKFSQWLIHNRIHLQEKAPELYNQILGSMLFVDKDTLLHNGDGINDQLKKLINLHICDFDNELFISHKDFIPWVDIT